MNISKFTQKSIEAVQNLEKVAYSYGNQEIEQEHLLYSLLKQEDSLILKLIEKMDINKDYFINTVEKALDEKVKVSGGELRFGQYLNKALVNAEDEAKSMGDEGIWNYTRKVFAGFVYCKRKSKSGQRQSGGYL